MHYQILIRKFCLTHNRSLDGILNKLNSKNLKEGGSADLVEYVDSDDEDYDNDKSLINNLPGVTNKKVVKGKKFNVPIKIISVKFSHTNRSWAVGTTEGIYIYSLDTSLNFAPISLDLNITIKNAEEAFLEGSFLKALIFSFYLNKNELMTKFINNIPMSQIALIASKIPFNVVGPLLDLLSKLVETDKQLQLYMIWILNILKSQGDNLKNLKNKTNLLNLNKSLNRSFKGLSNLLEENIFSIKYITESEFSDMQLDEETNDY